MSGMWDRTLVYLGLREEPDEADDLPERFVPDRDPDAELAAHRTAVATAPADVLDLTEVGPVGASRSDERPAGSNVRPLRSADVVLRPVGSIGPRAALVRIERFDDVEAVGARYRTGQPVLFDLSAADATTARRVVDFVSGVTYALRGRLTKVGSRAFLLLPDGVELPADEEERLRGLGYRVPAGSGA